MSPSPDVADLPKPLAGKTAAIEWRDDVDWRQGPTRDIEPLLESGAVIAFARLAFEMSPAELHFLDPRFAASGSKNISVRGATMLGQDDAHGDLRGAHGDTEELAQLRAMIVRYGDHAKALVERLFPHYRGHLRRGNTSLRTHAIEGRASSWRQDDTRLHVDAFPSNPAQGTRLLRVFTNLNREGKPRHWRVGEPFEAFAQRQAARLHRPLPGSAWLLERLHVTKARRTEYDAWMLRLHDLAKADAEFQRTGPQLDVGFAPGTTWVVFSDQVLHAAMGGQHMLEQTFYLDPDDQLDRAASPLAILERIAGRPLRPARRR